MVEINVRKFFPKSRLRELIERPGGKTVESAVKDAETEMEPYRPKVERDLDVKLEELERLIAAPDRRGDAETVDDLGYLAAAILDTSGYFNKIDLGRAAYSLCDLLERMRCADVWDWPSVEVHVGSMRLLSGMAEADPAQRAALLAGLSAVTARIPAPPAEPAPPPPAT